MLFGDERTGGDYERLIALQRPEIGLRAIVVLHSLRRGPAFGGIRRRDYKNQDSAQRDAMRLARAMSLKCALASLPAGGGKTVIMDSPELDREHAYEALGELIADLGGSYVCGPDVGTRVAELEHVRRKTEWVNPVDNDAGASTAAGVLAGLRGVLAVLDGDESFGGRRYAVQGLGSVGLALARALRDTGSTVFAHDPNPTAREEAHGLGVTIVEANELMDTECDVFMPCALGGFLDDNVVLNLRCRAICGSANNQLANRRVGAALAQRGILYAPDFCVNAGAVIEGVITISEGQGEAARERVRATIDGIAETTETILRWATEQGRTPEEVAVDVARARLTEAQG